MINYLLIELSHIWSAFLRTPKLFGSILSPIIHPVSCNNDVLSIELSNKLHISYLKEMSK